MGSKGSNTVQTQSGPPGWVQNAYKGLLTQAQNVSQTPVYSGELTAPINAQQQTGVGNINQYAFGAQPAIGTAEQYFQNSAQPLTTDQIQQYQSPYTQDVINATMANFAEGNAQQQQQVVGNAAAQGALGGDRVGVAQAELARQQNLSEMPTIAGLENTGYNQAVQLAMQQFQQNPQAAGYGLANTAIAGQGAGLQGAGAQFGAGTAEQQTQQALDLARQQQYYYPYQSTGWLAGVETGIGSGAGGTSSTTYPAPSMFGQLAGLGIAGAGAYGAYMSADRGGRVRGYDLGGTVADDFSPSAMFGPMQITRGPGPPKPPQAPSQQQQNPMDMVKQAQGIAGMFKGHGAGSASADPASWTTSGADLGTIGPGVADAGVAADVGAGVADAGAAGGADLLPLLLLAKRGGRIYRNGGATPIRAGLGMASFVPRRGYQEGGVTTIPETFPDTSGLGFADRWAPAQQTWAPEQESDLDVSRTEPTREGGLGAIATRLGTDREPPPEAYQGQAYAGIPVSPQGIGRQMLASQVAQAAYRPSSDESQLPPVMRSAPQGGAGLGYDEGQPTGGLRAPPPPQPTQPPPTQTSAQKKRPRQESNLRP